MHGGLQRPVLQLQAVLAIEANHAWNKNLVFGVLEVKIYS
jgi:hypothetical protein